MVRWLTADPRKEWWDGTVPVPVRCLSRFDPIRSRKALILRHVRLRQSPWRCGTAGSRAAADQAAADGIALEQATTKLQPTSSNPQTKSNALITKLSPSCAGLSRRQRTEHRTSNAERRTLNVEPRTSKGKSVGSMPLSSAFDVRSSTFDVWPLRLGRCATSRESRVQGHRVALLPHSV